MPLGDTSACKSISNVNDELDIFDVLDGNCNTELIARF
jgi:hypothetical protein